MRNLVRKKSFFRIITGPKDCDRSLEQFLSSSRFKWQCHAGQQQFVDNITEMALGISWKGDHKALLVAVGMDWIYPLLMGERSGINWGLLARS